MRLGFLAFIVPFAFCYDPGLLLRGTLVTNLWAILSGAVAIFAFGYFWMGYITRPIPAWLRILLLCAGVLTLFPQNWLVLVSAAVIACAWLFSRFVPARSGV